MTYSTTKFEVPTYNGLGGDTFTRNVTDGRTHGRTDGRWTDFDTKLIYPFFLKKKAGIIKNAATWSQILCQQTPYTLPLTLGTGSIGQISTFFSEHGHVAYQIKGITKCSNMTANILLAEPPPPPPPPTLGIGSIGKNLTFSEHGHVAYQIKWVHKM